MRKSIMRSLLRHASRNFSVNNGMYRSGKYRTNVIRDMRRKGEDSLFEADYKPQVKDEFVNPNLTPTEIYEKNRAMLSVILMLYIYSNDDNIISRKESKNIKKFMKNHDENFTKQDKITIMQLSNRSYSRESLEEYVERYKISKKMLAESITILKRNIDSNYDYFKLLNELDLMLFPNGE